MHAKTDYKMAEGLKTVGGRIAVLRAMGKLSQKDLAKLCNINDSSIENIELGRTTIKKEQAIQIIKALRKIGITASADWIIDGSSLLPSTLDFSNTNVLYDIMNSTIKLIINDANDFIKVGSIILALSSDISKITDEPFVIVKHDKNIFACKASKSHKKIVLQKKINSKAIDLTDEMDIYFPSIIIMKQ